MADTLGARVARLEVKTDVLSERAERMESKLDVAITKLDKIDMNGQTALLKRLAQPATIDGLISLAQRHQENLAASRFLSRVTGWNILTKPILIFAIGGTIGVLIPAALPHIIAFLAGL